MLRMPCKSLKSCQLIMHVFRWNTPWQSPLSCGNDLSRNEMRSGVFSQGDYFDLYDALVFLWVPCQVLRREPGDQNDDLVCLWLKFIVVVNQPVLPVAIVLCSMFWNKCAIACGDSLNGGNFRQEKALRASIVKRIRPLLYSLNIIFGPSKWILVTFKHFWPNLKLNHFWSHF